MKNVTIYIKPTCPFCKKALMVLKRQGVQPNIIDIAKQPALRKEMITKAGGRTTVPQIFADDEYIGDCSKIVQLEKEGKLSELVQ